MRRSLLTIVAFLTITGMGTGAHAQGIARSLDELRLLTRPGQTVTITEPDGTEVSGRITSLGPGLIQVRVNDATRAWKEGEIQSIQQRLPDSLSNGALLGLGVGAGLMALGVAAVGVEDGDEGYAALAIAVYGGIGAGIGVGIDALIKSKQVIYERPGTTARWRVSPFVTRTSRGAQLAVRF